MTQIAGNQTCIYTFFARQPIFDARKHVFGYELLYRQDAQKANAPLDETDVANLCVISATLTSPNRPEEERERIFIRISSESIAAGIPAALPPGSTVVELDAQPTPDAALLAGLADARQRGYTLALNASPHGECAPGMAELADFIFLNVHGKSQEDLEALIRRFSVSKARLAAKRVEDEATFELAGRLGFELFQGPFFKRPVLAHGHRLPSNKATRLGIYRSLVNSRLNADELAAIIESDVSVCFRLLTLINSVAFGMQYKVNSIKHAIMLLGWEHLKNWLWFVVLSDVLPKDKTQELPRLSAIRAKFLEKTAAGHGDGALSPEKLFLLGLFSLLEAMLDTPMESLVKELPLDEDVKAALCGRPNLPHQWLELARCFETGDWARLDALMDILHLDSVIVAGAYYEAVNWAGALYAQTTPES